MIELNTSGRNHGLWFNNERGSKDELRLIDDNLCNFHIHSNVCIATFGV